MIHEDKALHVPCQLVATSDTTVPLVWFQSSSLATSQQTCSYCCHQACGVWSPNTVLCPLCRRKLSQASTLSVGVTASGFTSPNTASQAITGFTNAIGDGSLQSTLQQLASWSVSSVYYTQQPTITTSAAVVGAVPAPSSRVAKKSLPGMSYWSHI